MDHHLRDNEGIDMAIIASSPPDAGINKHEAKHAGICKVSELKKFFKLLMQFAFVTENLIEFGTSLSYRLVQGFSNFFIPSPPFHSRHVVFAPQA